MNLQLYREARERVKDIIRKQGLKVSSFEAKEVSTLAKELIKQGQVWADPIL